MAHLIIKLVETEEGNHRRHLFQLLVEPCLDPSESDVVVGSPPADIEGASEKNSIQTPQQTAQPSGSTTHSNPKFHIRNFIKSNYKIKGMYLVTAFLLSMSRSAAM